MAVGQRSRTGRIRSRSQAPPGTQSSLLTPMAMRGMADVANNHNSSPLQQSASAACLLYPAGCFVAVKPPPRRNESFWLCCILQDVVGTAGDDGSVDFANGQIKVHWLELSSREDEGVYIEGNKSEVAPPTSSPRQWVCRPLKQTRSRQQPAGGHGGGQLW